MSSLTRLLLLRSILLTAYQDLLRAASVNVLLGIYHSDGYLIFINQGRYKTGPAFAMRLMYLVVFVGYFHLGVAHANPADDRFTFYFSVAHNLSADTPKLSVEDNLSRSKWFDDNPSIKSVGKIEIGVENRSAGYTVGLRVRTLSGNHSGSIAKYECLLAFCGWVDGVAVVGDGVADQVTYQVRSRQLWIKKSFEFSDLALGLIGGVNHLKVDSDIRGALGSQELTGEAPLPFIGTDVRFRINENTYLMYNLHYLNWSRDNDKVKFVDAELELAYRLTKHLQIAVGNNHLTVHLRKQSGSGTAELLVPQRTPYVRISLIY
jgi:hypothetical protein